jgi:hypothetical protein
LNIFWLAVKLKKKARRTQSASHSKNSLCILSSRFSQICFLVF